MSVKYWKHKVSFCIGVRNRHKDSTSTVFFFLPYSSYNPSSALLISLAFLEKGQNTILFFWSSDTCVKYLIPYLRSQPQLQKPLLSRVQLVLKARGERHFTSVSLVLKKLSVAPLLQERLSPMSTLLIWTTCRKPGIFMNPNKQVIKKTWCFISLWNKIKLCKDILYGWCGNNKNNVKPFLNICEEEKISMQYHEIIVEK